MTQVPETRYAKTADGAHVASRVMGAGPDPLVVPDGPIPIDAIPEEPHYERFVRRPAGFSRVILFDRRCLGLSDPVTPCFAIKEGREAWSESNRD